MPKVQSADVADLAIAESDGGRIVGFLQDPVEIKKIMASLGLPDYTAPPPLPKSSPAEFE